MPFLVFFNTFFFVENKRHFILDYIGENKTKQKIKTQAWAQLKENERACEKAKAK